MRTLTRSGYTANIIIGTGPDYKSKSIVLNTFIEESA